MSKKEIRCVGKFCIGDPVRCGKVTAHIESFPTRNSVNLKNIDYERLQYLPWMARRGHWGMATKPISKIEKVEEDEDDEIPKVKVLRRKWWICFSRRMRRDVEEKVAYG
jgi:hypothetical protein